jgi:hypothetical protein
VSTLGGLEGGRLPATRGYCGCLPNTWLAILLYHIRPEAPLGLAPPQPKPALHLPRPCLLPLARRSSSTPPRRALPPEPRWPTPWPALTTCSGLRWRPRQARCSRSSCCLPTRRTCASSSRRVGARRHRLQQPLQRLLRLWLQKPALWGRRPVQRERLARPPLARSPAARLPHCSRLLLEGAGGGWHWVALEAAAAAAPPQGWATRSTTASRCWASRWWWTLATAAGASSPRRCARRPGVLAGALSPSFLHWPDRRACLAAADDHGGGRGRRGGRGLGVKADPPFPPSRRCCSRWARRSLAASSWSRTAPSPTTSPTRSTPAPWLRPCRWSRTAARTWA